MKIIKQFLLIISISCLAGCGTFWAGIMDNSCPYSGVKFDLSTLTDAEFILSGHILMAPLIIVDIPFSFIWDTILLDETYGKTCRSFY
jgi:uncharacterized protein YceK